MKTLSFASSSFVPNTSVSELTDKCRHQKCLPFNDLIARTKCYVFTEIYLTVFHCGACFGLHDYCFT